MNNFKIGDRVIHQPYGGNGYGAGIIKGLQSSQNMGKASAIADVLFDVVPADKKQIRRILVDYLILESDATKEFKNAFNVGDYVFHGSNGLTLLTNIIRTRNWKNRIILSE